MVFSNLLFLPTYSGFVIGLIAYLVGNKPATAILFAVAIVSFGTHLWLQAWPVWHFSSLFPFEFAAKLRRSHIARDLGLPLDSNEELIADSVTLNGSGVPVWLGLTNKRLLHLNLDKSNGKRVEIRRNLDLAKIIEMTEREHYRSKWMILMGLALMGVIVLPVREPQRSDMLWLITLAWGGLMIATWGWITDRHYNLKIESEFNPEWSFTSEGLGDYGQIVERLRKLVKK